MRTVWIVVAILLVFWLVGAIINVVGSVIHALLIVAVLIVVIVLLRRRSV